MKKQEIKQDPIRDYIVNAYNYFADNKSILYTSVGCVAGLLFIFIFINNNTSKKLMKSNAVSSSAQNFYIDSEFELADTKFEELLNGNYSQESINQAIIYKMKDALDNNEDINALSKQYKFKSSDSFLTSLYNIILGDYNYNNANYSDAVNYYKKSLYLFDQHPDVLIDAKISLIDTYLLMEDISKAKKEIDSVDEEALSIQSSTKYKSFLTSISSTMK